jgi:hypothetical protein
MAIGPERSCTSRDPVQKDVRCQMTERLCHRKDIFVPEESRKGNPKDRGKRKARGVFPHPCSSGGNANSEKEGKSGEKFIRMKFLPFGPAYLCKGANLNWRVSDGNFTAQHRIFRQNARSDNA